MQYRSSWANLPGDLLELLLRSTDLAGLCALASTDLALRAELQAHPLWGNVLAARRSGALPHGLVWAAVLRSDPELLGWLLASDGSADPGRCAGGLAPLDYARANGDERCARLLLDHCGEPVRRRNLTGRVERLPSGGPGEAVLVEVGLGVWNGRLVVLRRNGTVEICGPSQRTRHLITGQGLPPVTQLSCGKRHIAAVAGGRLWVAGDGGGALRDPDRMIIRPEQYRLLPSAVADGAAVVQVATLDYATYALTDAGHIWGWGFDNGFGFLPGFDEFVDPDDDEAVAAARETEHHPRRIEHVMRSTPLRTCAPHRMRDEADTYADAPPFRAIAATEDSDGSLLAALSHAGELFCCGGSIGRSYENPNESGGWCMVLTQMATPGPVAAILLTRTLPNGQFVSHLPWREGGRWLPDYGDKDPAPVAPAAHGLLALMGDGTVFAALQQAPVPGLAGVRSMAECGGSVAFEVARPKDSRVVVVVR